MGIVAISWVLPDSAGQQLLAATGYGLVATVFFWGLLAPGQLAMRVPPGIIMLTAAADSLTSAVWPSAPSMIHFVLPSIAVLAAVVHLVAAIHFLRNPRAST